VNGQGSSKGGKGYPGPTRGHLLVAYTPFLLALQHRWFSDRKTCIWSIKKPVPLIPMVCSET